MNVGRRTNASGTRKRKASALGVSDGDGDGRVSHERRRVQVQELHEHNADSRTATWVLDDIRNTTYIPDSPIPTDVLVRLREKMDIWDASPRPWAKKTGMRRCANVKTKKKETGWPNGEGYRCGYCARNNELCVVAEEGDKITLLPSHRDVGAPAASVTDVSYWIDE